MPEDIVSLGFKFDPGNTSKEIGKIIAGLDKLNSTAEKTKASLQNMIPRSFEKRLNTSANAIGKFSASMGETARYSGSANISLNQLVKSLQAIKGSRVPQAFIGSLREITSAGKQATAALSRMNQQINAVNANRFNKLSTSFNTVSNSTENMTAVFTQLLVSVGFVKFFSDSTAAALKFGDEIAHINSMAQEFNIENIKNGLLSLDATHGSAIRNANALYYAYSSGVRGSEKDILNFTAKMAQLATLIRADVTPTVDAVTSALNAYNLTAGHGAEMTDLFYGIVKQGKAEGQQLATGLGQVISTAASANVSLNELAAGVTSLTKVMQTRNAITYFNNMLSKLIKPTKEARLAARSLGIELGLNALQAKGLAGMMREIHDKTQGAQEKISSLFPDLRGFRAATHLLVKGWGDFNEQLTYFENKAGIAQEAMQQLTKNRDFQINQIPATVEKIKIATGELAVDVFTLNGILMPLLELFNGMNVTAQKVFGSLGLIAGGFVALKTSATVLNAAKLIEMATGEKMSVQRQKEIAERNAIAAAVFREVELKKSLAAIGFQNPSTITMSAQNVAMTKQYAAENLALAKSAQMVTSQNLALAKTEFSRTVVLSKLLTAEKMEIQTQIQEASATGNQIRLETLLAKLEAVNVKIKEHAAAASVKKAAAVRAETAAIVANNLAMQAENKNRVASMITPVADKSNTIKSIASTQIGFGKGFKLMIQSMTGVSSIAGKAAKGIALFKTVLTGLGAFLGKASVIAVGVANIALFLAPIAVAFDYVQSFLRTGSFFEGSMYVTKFMSWVTGVSKLIETSKKLDGVLQEKIDLVKARKNLELFTGNIKSIFANSVFDEFESPEISFIDRLKQFNKNFGSELIKAGVDFNPTKVNVVKSNVEQRMNELSVINEQMITAIKTGDSDWLKRLEIEKESAQKRYDEAKKAAEKMEQQAKSSSDRLMAASRQILKTLSAQIESIKSLRDLQESVKFDMMSPDEQIGIQKNKYNQAFVAYTSAVAIGNMDFAEEQFKKMTANYKAIIRDAKNKIKSAGDLMQTIDSAKYDSDLAAAPDTQSKIKIMNDRANELWEKSATLVGTDLTKAYNEAQKAIQLQIKAVQMEEKEQKNLQQSIYRVNESTAKLIQSMDKYKTAAYDAVNANSTDAVKLQNRFFSAIPKMPSLQQTETSAPSAKLEALFKKQQDMQTMFNKKALEMQQKAEATQNQYNTMMKDLIDRNQDALLIIEQSLKEWKSGMKDSIQSAIDGSATVQQLKNYNKQVNDALNKLGVAIY